MKINRDKIYKSKMSTNYEKKPKQHKQKKL